MELVDPATGRPLPSDAIQRVLFLASGVHVYNVPPLSSMRGHSAASWTADASRHIFTARLRVIETASPGLKVDVVLEDPATGQLFAAAPYTDRAAVEPAVDSSRFFAMTVRDGAGRKAVLGIGFEDRSDAFDLAVALQEARRSLGWDAQRGSKPEEQARDYSLKEGETITVNLAPSQLGRRRAPPPPPPPPQQQGTAAPPSQSFALSPPPPASKPADPEADSFALPPPPSAQDVKRKRRSLRDLGFDDGQFGEFA